MNSGFFYIAFINNQLTPRPIFHGPGGCGVVGGGRWGGGGGGGEACHPHLFLPCFFLFLSPAVEKLKCLPSFYIYI